MSGKRPRFPKNASVPPILRMGGTGLQHKRGPSLGAVLFHILLRSPQWQTEVPAPAGAAQGVPGSGPMYPEHGLRRPLWKVCRSFRGGAPRSSVPTGSRRNHPGKRRTAERLRHGCEESAEAKQESPQRPQQRRTIPQSPSGRQLPLHKGAFPWGGTGNMGTVGSPQQRAAEVVGSYGFSGHPPSRSGAVSGRDGLCQAQPGHLLLDAFLAGAHGLDGPLQQGVQLPA